ncbi:Retrovirus-related Pol polyprotein from transposon 17.6, partial [Mucuna pruriens]
MKHPTEDHSLFGIDVIDELVKECMQLDTDSVEIPNFVELLDVTDYFNSVTDVSDSLASLYRLSKAESTRKDHFGKIMRKVPLLFSGWIFRIHRNPNQHKTTFTCPFGTFAYTQMSFGLCNALSMFQRCMINIFSDLLEDCMEVFIDDFAVYAESFEACLENLSRVLTRCIKMNLVLNFEKCHFMVTKGIILGHLISSRRIEVDKAKVDIITSLSNPAYVHEVHSFLRHAGFYRRFIKNFNKIALPLSLLLQNDVDFVFDQPCMEAFQELKKRLTSIPILQVLNWEYPFD